MTTPSHVVIGIDPGRTGAIVVLSGSAFAPEVVAVFPASVYYPPKGGINAVRLREALSSIYVQAFGHTLSAFIEKPGLRRRESPTSTFTTGAGFGAMLATLEIANIATNEVSAVKWTRFLGVEAQTHASPKQKKELHAAFMQRVTPSLNIRGPQGGLLDGIADAACIAIYGLHRINGTKP